MNIAAIKAEYFAADLAYAEAFEKYVPIRDGFRAGNVSFEDFGAAVAAFKIVSDRFDAAFAAMQDVPEDEPETIAIDDGQKAFDL
jgi:hypothetical protein